MDPDIESSDNLTEAADEIQPVAAEITFERKQADTLYRTGFMETHPHRWLRISEEVRFEDVVTMLTGDTRMVISCPFHGRDSTPSFHIYRRGNDAYCFGCPPGEQYYDSVIFASKKLGVSRLAALVWLEKQFNLAPIADIDPEEYEEEQDTGTVQVNFRDLIAPFVVRASKDVQTSKDVEIAEEYLSLLFDGFPAPQEEKADPNAGDPMPLARVLGRKLINEILRRKLQGK